jgi:LmbE family N-acetylglucosaminyl deacetylase
MRRMVNLVAADLRRAARRTLALAARDVTGTVARRSVLVVAPHPDDETIGCAARILLSTRAGAQATIVVVTDGSASHGDDGVDFDALRTRRRSELNQAAGQLGVRAESVIWLGYPDGKVPDYVAGVAAALTRLIDDVAPDDVYVTCGQESHPDHAASAKATAIAIRKAAASPRLLEYPIWLWADWPISRNRRSGAIREILTHLAQRSVERVPVAPFVESKRAALDCYRSQLGEQGLVGDGSSYAISSGAVALPRAVVRRALIGPELFFIRSVSQLAAADEDSTPSDVHLGDDFWQRGA